MGKSLWYIVAGISDHEAIIAQSLIVATLQMTQHNTQLLME